MHPCRVYRLSLSIEFQGLQPSEFTEWTNWKSDQLGSMMTTVGDIKHCKLVYFDNPNITGYVVHCSDSTCMSCTLYCCMRGLVSNIHILVLDYSDVCKTNSLTNNSPDMGSQDGFTCSNHPPLLSWSRKSAAKLIRILCSSKLITILKSQDISL